MRYRIIYIFVCISSKPHTDLKSFENESKTRNPGESVLWRRKDLNLKKVRITENVNSKNDDFRDFGSYLPLRERLVWQVHRSRELP